MTTLW